MATIWQDANFRTTHNTYIHSMKDITNDNVIYKNNSINTTSTNSSSSLAVIKVYVQRLKGHGIIMRKRESVIMSIMKEISATKVMIRTTTKTDYAEYYYYYY